jgi:hypothetical protein
LRGDAFWRLQVPFIDDLASHVRFLFAVPILVLTEIPLARRMRHTMGHFLAARLIRERDVERFSEAIAEAGRLRDSRVAEALLVAAMVFACWVAVQKGLSAGVGTWFEPTREGGYSLAGLWYVFVSIPIFQFLLLRWFYRVVVWTRFLWHLSKINLVLTPTHPDAAGRLMFLGEAVLPFGAIMARSGSDWYRLPVRSNCPCSGSEDLERMARGQFGERRRLPAVSSSRPVSWWRSTSRSAAVSRNAALRQTAQ